MFSQHQRTLSTSPQTPMQTVQMVPGERLLGTNCSTRNYSSRWRAPSRNVLLGHHGPPNRRQCGHVSVPPHRRQPRMGPDQRRTHKTPRSVFDIKQLLERCASCNATVRRHRKSKMEVGRTWRSPAAFQVSAVLGFEVQRY